MLTQRRQHRRGEGFHAFAADSYRAICRQGECRSQSIDLQLRWKQWL